MMLDLRKAGLWAIPVLLVPLLAQAEGVYSLPGGVKFALPGTGITATLTHVTDQRCPSAIDCYWEGMKRAEVLLSDGRHPPVTVVLCNLCEDGDTEAAALGHRLTLIDLMPPVVEIEALGRNPLLTDYAAVVAVDGGQMRDGGRDDAGDWPGNRPFSGAKAAILIGDRLLVTLRDDRDDIPYPNLWDLPGGGREGSETAEATLLREVFEEVGLRLTADSIIWRRAFPSHTGTGNVGWFFVIRLPAGAAADIVFGDEGQGWALESPEAFMARRDAVPFLQHRLGVWLAARP